MPIFARILNFTLDEYVQREFNYTIVDPLDSIPIDEALVPSIISGPSEELTDKYYKINQIIPRLKKECDYFSIDQKSHGLFLRKKGVAHVESYLNVQNLYDNLAVFD